MSLHERISTIGNRGEVLPGQRARLIRCQCPNLADHHSAASPTGVPVLDNEGAGTAGFHADAEPTQLGVPAEDLFRGIGTNAVNDAFGNLGHRPASNLLTRGRKSLPSQQWVSRFWQITALRGKLQNTNTRGGIAKTPVLGRARKLWKS